MSSQADWKPLEARIDSAVKLSRRPVAVAFLDGVPEGISRFEGVAPASCSFWRLAASGQVFYTVPADHFNCAVGAYTHHIPLSPERANESEQTFKMLFDVGYLKPQEVPQIPQLPKQPSAIVYAPLGQTPVAPDVVIIACRPSSAMLFNEAAQRAGVAGAAVPLGRPTCMALPMALQHGAVASLGCIGNRVYTELGSDEMYVVVHGKDLPAIVEELNTVVDANAALAEHARTRRLQLETSVA